MERHRPISDAVLATPLAYGAKTLPLLGACFVIGALVSMSTPAWAQADSLLEISGFDLLNPPGADGTVDLVALTRTGQPIPDDQISFKTKDNVVRVTYRGVTLAKGLGNLVPLNPRGVKRVKKAYAIRDGDQSVFVRIKFNGRAKRALAGGRTSFVQGATVTRFPFGAKLAAGAPVTMVPELSGDNTAPKAVPPAAAPVAEASSVPVAPPAPAESTAPKTKTDALADGMFEWANPQKPSGEVSGADGTAVPAKTNEATAGLGLADRARGPSITKVVGAMFVIVLLIAVLALASKKLRNLRGGGFALSGDGVQVLARYPVSKGNKVLVLEVLDEVLVVSQNPSGDLSLLHHMPQDRADALRQGDYFANDTLGTGLFDGLLRRRKVDRPRRTTHSFVRDSSDDVDDYAGTLSDLAESLESNARAGALRETPTPSTKITPLFADGGKVKAASDDARAEPIDFQELLARRAAHKGYHGGTDMLPKVATARKPTDTVSISSPIAGQTDEVTRGYRERIRSLGKI